MHTVATLYSASHDFSRREEHPWKTFMLATIPRSGSTYFAIRLWQTGALGAPMEYLNFPILGKLLRRLRIASPLDTSGVLKYWRAVKALRTSPNGVFGYKMFMNNYVNIARAYPSLLADIVPNTVIYLVRRNTLEQAISYSRAIRSKRWFAESKDKEDVIYDGDHIQECIRSIEEQRTFWEDAFKLTGVSPIRVYYEDFLQNQQATIDSIVSTVCGTSYAVPPPVPSIEKQQDSFNAIWKIRFLAERRMAEETYHYSR